MKRKGAPLDSGSTFLEPTSSIDGGGGSSSPIGRPRPQGSKRAKEERWLTTSAENAAWAHVTATKAMADATFKKAQVMKDQNVFMLITHPLDGVISDTATRYLKLRQEEELKKLEARLAEARARKVNAHHSPPSIPVETLEALQRRGVAALGTSRRSLVQQ